MSRAKLGLESESNNDEVLPFNKDEDDELAVVAEVRSRLQQKLILRKTAYNHFQEVDGNAQGTSNHKSKDTQSELLEPQKDSGDYKSDDRFEISQLKDLE